MPSASERRKPDIFYNFKGPIVEFKILKCSISYDYNEDYNDLLIFRNLENCKRLYLYLCIYILSFNIKNSYQTAI